MSILQDVETVGLPIEGIFVEQQPYEDSDDPNKRAHIVNPPDNPHISNGFPDMEGHQVVDIARAMRIEIMALCGYKFIPVLNPDKYDACTQCFKVAEWIMKSEG